MKLSVVITVAALGLTTQAGGALAQPDSAVPPPFVMPVPPKSPGTPLNLLNIPPGFTLPDTRLPNRRIPDPVIPDASGPKPIMPNVRQVPHPPGAQVERKEKKTNKIDSDDPLLKQETIKDEIP